MTEFSFSTKAAGNAIALAKIVKPESNDFCLRFDESQLVVFSYDKRRYVRAVVNYRELPDSYSPEELYLTADKTALLEARDLDTVFVNFKPSGVSLRAEGGGHKRSTTMKRKSRKSRRPPIPPSPSASALIEERPDVLRHIFSYLSCSAQVKLKSDEEMRVNQVHFYPDGYAVSTTRHFMTVVRHQLGLDLSVVGADLPAMRAFCERVEDSGSVSLRQDDRYLYLVGCPIGSVLALSRVASKKPALEVLDSSDFSSSVVIKKDQITRSSTWAALTSQEEGTSRVNLSVESDGAQDVLVLRFGNEVVAKSDCSVEKGKPFSLDLHIKYFSWILGYVEGASSDDRSVRLQFGHPKYPTVICLSPGSQHSGFQVHHYLQSMVKH